MVGLAVALALRRRNTLVAVVLTIATVCGLELIDQGVSENLVAPFFAVLVIAYSLGANLDGDALIAGAVILFAGGMTATQLSDGGFDDVVFVSTIMIGGPFVLGRVVRARSQLNRALREKAAVAERSRDIRAAVAVVGERTRIAGELHRHISAALGTMVQQATRAERLARTEPAGAEQAFEAVERTGREALREIRELLGVLRRDDEELALAPQPSLAHLSDLVARMRAAGLPVELEVEGRAQALPAGLDLTAYRVVQEALGGPFDISAGRRATVRLRYGEQELVLEVLEDGAQAPRRALLGMHERVAMYGGELVAAGARGARPAPAGADAVTRFWTGSTRAWDALVAGAVLVVATVETLLAPEVPGHRWAGVLVLAAMCALLLVRRTHPLPAVVVMIVLALIDAAFVTDVSDVIAMYFPLLILAYSVAAYAPLREAGLALALLLGAAVAIEALDHQVGNAIFPMAVVALCWLGGRNVRARTRLAAELHEAAAQAAEEREARAAQAVADERRRIAREMHDVVAHSISIMVVQAGGARSILPFDAGRAQEAAAGIRRTGTEALAEMSTLLNVLDTPSTPPSLDALPELVRAGA